MILAQLGMDRTDRRVEKAREYIFQFQLEDGGFSSYTLKRAKGEHTLLLKKGKKLPLQDEFASSLVFEHQYFCLIGNMAVALIRIGYASDKRVKKALEWLVKIQNPDGGWLCLYWQAHMRDKHGCFYGTICPLEAFSEVGKENLTGEMKETIEKGAEFLQALKLKPNEFVVVDTDAGIEHFGRGVEAGCDVIVAVAEPSYDSIKLVEKIRELSSAIGKKVVVIGSKFESSYMDFIRVDGYLPFKKEIFQACLFGKEIPCVDEAKIVVDAILFKAG